MLNFKNFIDFLVVEALHPELQNAVAALPGVTSKQTTIAKTIKNLTDRGEKTGIEGNMPKGSSRAYLKWEDKHDIVLDGKPTQVESGTKVAIKAQLDSSHLKENYDNLSLGALQNKAENGDHWVNTSYRILSEHSKGNYKTNKERGIFPPLYGHDDVNHEWTHVGHVRDIGAGEFRKLTKTPEFPKGISHEDFHTVLGRDHLRSNGRYWQGLPKEEARLDAMEDHPLIEKFLEYHRNTGNPPTDYVQKKNLGIWKHPHDGSEHIVARDHGFDLDVQKAYADARKRKYAQK